MNGFKDMDDFITHIQRTKDDLNHRIKHWMRGNGYDRVELKKESPHAVKLRIRKSTADDFIDVDLLPAMDHLNTKGILTVY